MLSICTSWSNTSQKKEHKGFIVNVFQQMGSAPYVEAVPFVFSPRSTYQCLVEDAWAMPYGWQLQVISAYI